MESTEPIEFDDEDQFVDVTRQAIQLKNGKTIRVYAVKQPNRQTQYPSVTTICSTPDTRSSDNDNIWLRKWAKKEPKYKEITLYGNTVGTFGHFRIQGKLAEKWGIPNPNLEFQPDQRKALNEWFDAFPHRKSESGIKDATSKMMMIFDQFDWDYDPQHPIQRVNGKIQNANINPLEFKVWSNKFGYAGSLDILAALKIGSETNLQNIYVDIKTNIRDDQKYELQCMGYAIAFREVYPNIPLDDFGLLHIPKDNKNYRYSFKLLKSHESELRIQWLSKVRKFYELYGDQSPMNQYRDSVLKNIQNEGI